MNLFAGFRQVAVFDYANNAFPFGPKVTAQNADGPPTVADFDGDGQPEFGVGGFYYYQMYDPLECSGKEPSPRCYLPSDGVLWSREINDTSSGIATAAAIDFNGGGIPELAFRDQ